MNGGHNQINRLNEMPFDNAFSPEQNRRVRANGLNQRFPNTSLLIFVHIDSARLCLKSVRLELVERWMGFDWLSPNGVNTSLFRINSFVWNSELLEVP